MRYGRFRKWSATMLALFSGLIVSLSHLDERSLGLGTYVLLVALWLDMREMDEKL